MDRHPGLPAFPGGPRGDLSRRPDQGPRPVLGVRPGPCRIAVGPGQSIALQAGPPHRSTGRAMLPLARPGSIRRTVRSVPFPDRRRWPGKARRPARIEREDRRGNGGLESPGARCPSDGRRGPGVKEYPVFVPYGAEHLGAVVTLPEAEPAGLVLLVTGTGAP